MRTPLLFAFVAARALAQGQPSSPPLPGLGAPPVTPPPVVAPAPPGRTIPPQIVLEVRELERQFDQALLRDCAPERCSSKGCVYREHLSVDLPPSTTSLPGLGTGEGPGSVPAQLYLTQARCEFTHEKSVPARDVEALARRLEQRLSKGFLKVTVSRQVLDPINPSLAESPPPKEDKPAPKEEPKPEPVAPPPPPKWDAEVALRELWQALLPHFSWMIAVFLATLATLVIIWAARRLGKETLEEKAMLAQLTQPPAPAPEMKPEATPPVDADAAFVAEQQGAWAKRIADTPLEKDDALVGHLLREWLRQGEFPLLAKATVLFGDRLSLAFQADPTLTAKKAELARYLQAMDAASLPTDAQFFRTLNQNAVAASLLAQPDTEVYRSLSDEFGSAAVVQLIEKLPPRHGALLFALTPMDRQDEVARLLPYPLKVGVAHQLLLSNRSSKHERAALFEAVGNAREGRPLKNGHAPVVLDVVDQGQEFDAAGALSILLGHLEDADRRTLFEKALSGDGFPGWYERILSPQMLLKVPAEQRTDLLLEVDVRGLAAWLSLQPASRREQLVGPLSASVQTALKASMAFASRAEQLEQAKKGQAELVASVRRRIAGGALSFPELVN
ncbi:MAG: hypothetical protein SFW67_09010 [Myxococcaceae bacterium]|nr:hypothetical protein [Myxococcaceae bacterium]